MSDQDRDITESKALQDEARAWLRRLTSGAATTTDIEALEHWRSQGRAQAQAFAEAALLWDVSGEATKVALDQNPALASGADCSEDLHLPRRLFISGGALLAASLVGLAVVRPPLNLWPSFSELEADYRTRTGERRNIEMSGGVSVELNTRTSIDLRPGTDGIDAIELVTGEAMIAKTADLSRGFSVYAAGGQTTATQASFNVRRMGNIVCVTCIGGGVEVRYRQSVATLQERQQIFYDVRGLGQVEGIDPKIVTAWRQGLLIFRDVPLAQVIDEVNRYRPGKIILVDSQLGRRQVVADFRLDRLDAVVEFAARVMKAPVRSLPGGIVLLG